MSLARYALRALPAPSAPRCPAWPRPPRHHPPVVALFLRQAPYYHDHDSSRVVWLLLGVEVEM